MTGDAIWLIGCGNMGGAMLRGWIADGLDPTRVMVIDPASPPVPDGIKLQASIAPDARDPAIALLAIKPQGLADAAAALSPHLGNDTILVSILAGVEIRTLRLAIPRPRKIVRVMPNTPAAIGRGVSVLFAQGLDEADRSAVGTLLAPLGLVVWIDDESLFDAVTAVSGSGPAFVFRMIEHMARAGEALGLDPALALQLATATVEGSAALVAASHDGPGVLADRVASPGGTTRQGLNVLDADNRFATLMAETLDATARRSAEMSAESRAAVTSALS